MAARKQSPDPTIRTLWGLAKSQELSLTGEELHLIVQAQTGKDSLKELNKREIKQVAYALRNMKDSAKRGRRKEAGEGDATSRQRQKVHALEHELGWADNPKRLSGFCHRMFRVDSVRWLNYEQCSKLIEAMKKMLERPAPQKEEPDEGLQTDADV